MMRLSSRFERGVLFGLMVLFCACGGRVILEQGSSEGTTGVGGADTSGIGATGGYNTAVVTAGVTAASGGPVSSSASGSPGATTCEQYCKELQSHCYNPGLSQYNDAQSCLGVCASLPQGKLGDTTGNSIECRAYHAGAAKFDPVEYCAHAGPTGGDLDPSDTMGGPCGEGCEAFCNLALKVCPGTFKDQQDCRAQCKLFKYSVQPYSTLETTGNSFSCRMYHLTFAATDSDAAITHCPHAALQSATCK